MLFGDLEYGRYKRVHTYVSVNKQGLRVIEQ